MTYEEDAYIRGRESAQRHIEILDSRIKTCEAKRRGLEHSIATQQRTIDMKEKKIGELGKKIKELETENKKTGELEKKIKRKEAVIKAKNRKIGEQEKKIKEREKKIKEQEAEIEALKNKKQLVKKPIGKRLTWSMATQTQEDGSEPSTARPSTTAPATGKPIMVEAGINACDPDFDDRAWWLPFIKQSVYDPRGALEKKFEAQESRIAALEAQLKELGLAPDEEAHDNGWKPEVMWTPPKAEK